MKRAQKGSKCFVSCGFLVHCYQTSLLTTLLPDNKNCVRILKGSYIVMKCSDNKVYETIWYLPSESARSTADKWLTLVLWHHYNVSHKRIDWLKNRLYNFSTKQQIYYKEQVLEILWFELGTKLYFVNDCKFLFCFTLIWVYFGQDSHTTERPGVANFSKNLKVERNYTIHSILCQWGTAKWPQSDL